MRIAGRSRPHTSELSLFLCVGADRIPADISISFSSTNKGNLVSSVYCMWRRDCIAVLFVR